MYYLINIINTLLVCSDQNSDVSDITACEGGSVWFTFNFTVPPYLFCEKYIYNVLVYHVYSHEELDPKQNFYHQYSDTGNCNVNITIENILSSYNNTLFQIEMTTLIGGKVIYKSNNFTLLVQSQ